MNVARRSPRSSLQTRIRAIILVASTLALLLASGAFLLYDNYSYRRTMVDRLRVLSSILAPQAGPALGQRDLRAASEILGRLSTAPLVVSAALFLEDGSRFVRYQRADCPDHAIPAAPGPDRLGADDGDLVLVGPSFADGKRTGTIYLPLDLEAAAGRP